MVGLRRSDFRPGAQSVGGGRIASGCSRGVHALPASFVQRGMPSRDLGTDGLGLGDGRGDAQAAGDGRPGDRDAPDSGHRPDGHPRRRRGRPDAAAAPDALADPVGRKVRRRRGALRRLPAFRRCYPLPPFVLGRLPKGSDVQSEILPVLR